MNNDELKKKIVEIIINAIWKDAEADYDSTDETEAGSIADALIAAGIGDVKTAQEIGASATAMAVLEAAKAEHRAEVAENELKLYKLAVKIWQERYSDIRCFNFNIALRQAEKELAEEKKSD